MGVAWDWCGYYIYKAPGSTEGWVSVSQTKEPPFSGAPRLIVQNRRKKKFPNHFYCFLNFSKASDLQSAAELFFF